MMARSNPPSSTFAIASSTDSQVPTTAWPSVSRKSSSIIAMSGSSSTISTDFLLMGQCLSVCFVNEKFYLASPETVGRAQGPTRLTYVSGPASSAAFCGAVAFEHFAHRLGELLDREGLGQEGDVRNVDRLPELLLGIAGD